MNDQTRKRLQRLRDAVDDMSGAYHPFGFGLLRPQPKVVPTTGTMECLESLIWPQFPHVFRHHGKLGKCDGWLDRSPDWSYCIWWWGDKKGVEEFKKWGDKLYGLLSEYPDLISVTHAITPDSGGESRKVGRLRSSSFNFSGPVQKPRLGYHGSLAALCSFAARDTALAKIEDRVVVDGRMAGPGADAREAASLSLPPGGTFGEGIKYVFTEIDVDAITLARRILDRLLGAPPEPSVVVDLERNIIYLDGTPVVTDDKEAALVVNAIASANGEVRGPTQIKRETGLPGRLRLERVLGRLPRPLQNRLEAIPRKGRRLRLP